MHKIAMIGTYFGCWPKWFPAFCLSCKMNDSIDWLIFSDSEVPQERFSNIKFLSIDLKQFNNLASTKLGLTIQKEKYSQVDLQPAYGLIFDEYIKGYDFWGHFDLDLIWGDIRNFISESILGQYHIISSRKNATAGHFTLFKNDPEINMLFKKIPRYREAFSNPRCVHFCERMLSVYLRRAQQSSNTNIYWPKELVADWPELEASPHGWHWECGKIYDKNKSERMYLHFMTWKRTAMKKIDFRAGTQPKKFRITRRGIWSESMPFYEQFLEAAQLGARIQLIRKSIRRLRYDLKNRFGILPMYKVFMILDEARYSDSPIQDICKRHNITEETFLRIQKNHGRFLHKKYGKF